jgi:hypothetical protein
MKHFALFALIISGCCTADNRGDFYNKLIESAKSDFGDFADGKASKMIRFHYVGRVNSCEGDIHVVYYSHVLTGMPAPRGYSAILFFDGACNYLGFLDSRATGSDARPLWCENGKLFLSGRTENMPQFTAGRLNNGNAIWLADGWDKMKLLDVYEYGSSGGINDAVPSEKDRADELRNLDSK